MLNDFGQQAPRLLLPSASLQLPRAPRLPLVLCPCLHPWARAGCFAPRTHACPRVFLPDFSVGSDSPPSHPFALPLLRFWGGFGGSPGWEVKGGGFPGLFSCPLLLHVPRGAWGRIWGPGWVPAGLSPRVAVPLQRDSWVPTSQISGGNRVHYCWGGAWGELGMPPTRGRVPCSRLQPRLWPRCHMAGREGAGGAGGEGA